MTASNPKTTRRPGQPYSTMDEIKEANAAACQHFFDPGTMRFFRSKVATRKPLKGQYFVTSEQFNEYHPRLYSIRVACPDTGAIGTIGGFQAYGSLRDALKVIKTFPGP